MVNTAHMIDVKGVRVFPEALDGQEQAALVRVLRDVAQSAPLFSPETRFGKKMSVRMTSAGSCGWVSDRRGYRYEPRHPSGQDWPGIPDLLLDIWRAVVPDARPPDTALINYYGDGAKMGLHQDRDEADFTQPVVSISLGDEALFRVGGTERGGKTESCWLHSGDVVVIGGDARLAYHGIDRVKHGSSMLLPQGGRINVTMRVVT